MNQSGQIRLVIFNFSFLKLDRSKPLFQISEGAEGGGQRSPEPPNLSLTEAQIWQNLKLIQKERTNQLIILPGLDGANKIIVNLISRKKP